MRFIELQHFRINQQLILHVHIRSDFPTVLNHPSLTLLCSSCPSGAMPSEPSQWPLWLRKRSRIILMCHTVFQKMLRKKKHLWKLWLSVTAFTGTAFPHIHTKRWLLIFLLTNNDNNKSRRTLEIGCKVRLAVDHMLIYFLIYFSLKQTLQLID